MTGLGGPTPSGGDALTTAERDRDPLYYDDKLELLADVFGAEDVRVDAGGVHLDGRFFPVLDDVIVALDVDRLPPAVRARIPDRAGGTSSDVPFAADVQRSFGEEWKAHPDILPDHAAELEAYFDLLPMEELQGRRVVDLGCGIGRWSYFIAEKCRDLVLVDYSEAIFVARGNLRHVDNTVFVMADVLDLPFRPDAFDLVVCLGVLHHLPSDALEAVRHLRPLARRQLFYLYYALDNRPVYFRWALAAVTRARMVLTRVESARARLVLSWLLAGLVYAPIAQLGRVLVPLGMERLVPMADSYAGKSVSRLRQEAYDRFFTRIEQRFTREEIASLTDVFAAVTVSERHPYWHFLCQRDAGQG